MGWFYMLKKVCVKGGDMYNRQKLYNDLRFFWLIVTLLLGVGILFIYSASCIFAAEKFGSSFYFVKKQLLGLLAAGMLFTVCALLPLQFLKKYSSLLFLAALLLTALTLVPGLSRTVHGSSRWLSIAGFAMQPSEFLKVTLFLYVAYLLDKKQNIPFSLLRSYLPLLCIIGITTLVLLMQPDFGLVVTLCLTFFMVLFISQLYTGYIVGTLALFIPVGLFLIYLKPYRVKRLFTYLNPWHDPQGAGFQIIQSLIAIGTGGVSGVGLSQSKQKFFYLPMQHTDFIFSIIAEETGFVGSFILIFLLILFLYVGLRIAWCLQNFFSFLLTVSFVFLLSLQSLINIGVATGILPTKGIGLPFVSYGVTCLLSSMAMIGLITNCVMEEI